MLKLKNVLKSIQVSQTDKFHVKHSLSQSSGVRIKIKSRIFGYWGFSGFIFDQLILFFKCLWVLVVFFPKEARS